jgi:prepilin peptidase CpaA
MTNSINIYLLVLTVTCVLTAAIIDVFTHRIPNWLTFPSAFLGLFINFQVNGIQGLFLSGMGLIAGFFLLFVAYWLGGMGAGDVKLLCAVGAMLGPKLVFYTFIWMALTGGALAIALIIYKKAFSQTLCNLKTLLLGWALRTSNEEANITIRNQSLIKMPYGVAIAAGAILAVYFRRIPSFGL